MKDVVSLTAKIKRAFPEGRLPYPKVKEENDWDSSEIVSKTIWSDPNLQDAFAKKMAEDYFKAKDHIPSLVFLGWQEFDNKGEDMIDLGILIRPHIPDPEIKPLV
jgi:hypothetical protein